MINQQKTPFFLDAASAFNILKAIPDHTRCFQTHQEGGYDGDFVGTVKEFVSTLEVVEKTCGDLRWNVHDKTVFLLELVIIRAAEITPKGDYDEHCVLLMYENANENLELPRLGTKEKPRDPKPMRSIDISRPAKA